MNNSKKLHIAVFPWLAFGHMLPFLELSKSLAAKGHQISFVSTPRNLERLQHKIPQNLTSLISLVALPLPRLENLPPDAEATSDLGFAKGTDILKKAYDGLQEPMAQFLESASASTCPLDWIIYDFSCHWLPPIADRFGIRKVFFSIIFARTLSVIGPSSDMTNDGAGKWTDHERLTRPIDWIPFPNNTVYFLPHEARTIFFATQKNSTGVSDIFRFKSCMNSSDVIAVRSCTEFEGEYLQLLETFHKKPVLPMGLLPVSIEEGKEDSNWRSIASWLEKQKKGYVVYVALGSEAEPSQEEITELAHGLEQSKFPFFWALKRSAGSSPVELPNGFVERTQDRGLVWTSWAPQLKILAHDSVGGFLTHCGWSSVIEALQFEKPLIMLPLTIDQGLYARFMVEKKAGIEILRNEEDGSFTRSSVAESLRQVMQDDTGKMYRDEAKKLSTIVADSLQDQYIDKFVEYLQTHT